MEHIDHLRQQGNARIDGNGVSGEALRFALAVEVFVERADACRHVFGKAQQAGDLGAALAALLIYASKSLADGKFVGFDEAAAHAQRFHRAPAFRAPK